MKYIPIIVAFLVLYGCGEDTYTQGEATCNAESPCIGGFCDPTTGICVSYNCSPGENSCKDETTLLQCNQARSAIEEQQCAFRCVDGGCIESYLCKTNQQECVDSEHYQTCSADRLSWEDHTCESGTFCVDGACKTPACTPGTKTCLDQYTAQSCNSNGTAHITINCKSDEICLDDLGECHILSCTPGEQNCIDGKVMQCKGDGSGWEEGTQCSGDQVCDPDQTCGNICCAATACTSGESRCFEGGDRYIEHCNTLQTGWDQPIACKTDERCSNNSCLPLKCVSLEKTCDGENNVVTCNEDGLDWVIDHPCAENEGCDHGRCLEIVCDGNQTTCDPENTQYYRQCNESGTGFSSTIRCPVGTICLDETGNCTQILCQKDEKRCLSSGEGIEVCNDSGTGFDPGVICEGEEQCVNGTCLNILCVPNSTECDGDQIKTCSEDGTQWLATANCPDTEDGTKQLCEENRCQPIICTPESIECVPGEQYHQFYQTCDSRGIGWLKESCGSGKICLPNGDNIICQTVSCIPGQKRCRVEDETVEVCNNNGTAFISDTTCEAEQYCDQGTCLPKQCEPDQFICEGLDEIRKCDSRGTRLSDPYPCGDGTLCQSNDTVGASCIVKPCNPGDTLCDGDEIKYCKGDGSDWSNSALCPGQRVCEANQCVSVICNPNTYSCYNSILRQQCNERGTAYKTPISCGSGKICSGDDSVATCITRVCEQGEKQCIDEQRYLVCNTTGDGFIISNDTLNQQCDTDQRCDQDRNICMEIICDAGQYRCSTSGNQVSAQRCNDTGTSWELTEICPQGDPICTEDGGCEAKLCEPYEELQCIVEGESNFKRCNLNGNGFLTDIEHCPSGYLCKSGSCTRQVCTPGSPVCIPNGNDASASYHTCNSDGTGYLTDVQCADEMPSVYNPTCYAGSCRTVCEMAAMNRSYMGCEYYAVELHNFNQSIYLDGDYAIILSNPSDQTASVTVHDPYDPDDSITATISPQSIEIIDTVNHPVLYTRKGGVAYKIESDLPVIAYQFSPLGGSSNQSNDASLLLPITAYGNQYRILSRAGAWEMAQTVTIVADQKNTLLEFTPKVNTLPGGGIPAIAANTTHTTTLAAGEVIQFTADSGNLNGSLIETSEPVGVFAGHQGAYVPESLGGGDHLEEQLFPTQTWGAHFLVVKTEPRGSEVDYYSLVTNENDTVIQFTPAVTDMDGQAVTTKTLQAGENFDFYSQDDFDLASSKSLLVGQFLAGSDQTGVADNATNGGDPAFILQVPVEQYRNDYLFLVPGTYDHNYVTIVAPDSATVELDGVALSDTDFTPIGTTGYKRLRKALSSGSHTIISDEPAGISVYGYSWSVSYGYPGGLNLKDVK